MNGYPFSPKTFELGDGNSISYLDEGSGPAVVMLHGNPTWSFYYRNLTALLQKGFRVIVPDHLGCGLSSKPQNYPYRLKNHIDNLEMLLNHLGLSELSLVLHDWGGAIGLGYGVRHPDRIRSLVILNTAAFPAKNLPLRLRLCRLPLLGAILVRGLNGFARAATYMAVNKRMAPEIARQYLEPYDSWKNRIAVLRFVQDIPMSNNHPSHQTLLEIEAGLHLFEDRPMLIVWGGRDFCFNDWFYREWRRRFPDSESTYFPEAGHYVLEDAFSEAGPLIRDFLERGIG
ncbi:MAG: alpha/beta fold hydrolase [Desulfurivibrionaceae bacterium]